MEGNFTYTVRTSYSDLCCCCSKRGLTLQTKDGINNKNPSSRPRLPPEQELLASFATLSHNEISPSGLFRKKQVGSDLAFMQKKVVCRQLYPQFLDLGVIQIVNLVVLSREDGYRGRVGLEDLSPVGRAMMGWPAKLDLTTSKTCPP